MRPLTRFVLTKIPFVHIPLRLFRATIPLSFYRATFVNIARWVFSSRELTNFTYDLSPRSLGHLAHLLSVVLERPLEEVEAYMEEPQRDGALREHVVTTLASAETSRSTSDSVCKFGRRLGWYVVVRALKPALVVETGVERGLGSVLLCSALLRNKAEGFPGRYRGLDVDPKAGVLLHSRFADVGEILYGDSIKSLTTLDGPIDVFVNDSDHSREYEYREYQIIKNKLSPGAVILGDNCHYSDSLPQFSREEDRRFLFFKETPDRHWYPEAGIGFSYHRR